MATPQDAAQLEEYQRQLQAQGLTECFGCGKIVRSLLGHLDKSSDPRCNESYHESYKKYEKRKSDFLKNLRDTHRKRELRTDESYRQEDNERRKRDEQKKGHEFYCNVCQQKFTLEKNLKRHMIDQHQEEKSFSCFDCPETFSRKGNLERHIAAGKHSFTHRCDFCKEDLVFKSQSAMYKHYVRDPPKTGKETCVTIMKKLSTNQAATCDGASAGPSGLQKRASPSSSPQRRTTQPRPSETCDICEIKFASKQVRDRYMYEQHSNPDQITCPICPKTFLRQEYVKDHIVQSHGCKWAKSYPCELCEQMFTQASNLTRHYHDVHKEKQRFACPECPQLFSRKESLNKHVERGKHTFYITCKYCNQDVEFKSDTEMHRHFKMEPDWAMDSWPRSKTCVNVLKWKEHDPVYKSYTCDHCLERIPNTDKKHGILDPTKSLSGHRDPKYDTLNNQLTCVNVLKKRDIITCSECKETFKFANLRDHYPPDTPFDLINRENISFAIAPCKVRMKEIELMRAGKWEEYEKVRGQRKS